MKTSPVSWLVDKLFPNNEIFGVPEGLLDHALQMESQKQQKYDEMLAMLEGILKICDEGYVEAYEGDFDAWETELNVQMEKARQLVKEAKEI
jgi:hypothetical protein